ncbi:MAG: AarF/ABC1/UbiB kinase family protein [Deltaproteobacteria bacterium]|nr:AarF/ABC1/UbiB kinase family protein [Deltaproteobacteria bacterium]
MTHTASTAENPAAGAAAPSVAAGCAAGAARVARVANRIGRLVLHLAGNLERLVGDVVRDSSDLARETEQLSVAVARTAVQVHAAVRATPRFSRIVKEVIALAARYRLQRTRAEIFGANAPETVAARAALDDDAARRLYELCIELRGGVLKIGQFASARVDLLPAAYVRELGKLQDRVPAVPTADIIARIESELGRPIGELYASFEDTPIAAASLAQVHGAVLHDGTRVAVKVQVPGIEDVVETDLAAFRVLASALKDLLPSTDLPTVAAELSRSVREELDYRKEADSLTRFAAMAGTTVVVPRPHPALSARRVLTMDRIDGARLPDWLAETDARGADGVTARDHLLGTMVRSFAAQILEHGLFHADPHPGNFLVAETLGSPPRLVMLDFGAVQEYGPAARAAYAELAMAILGGDAARMTELFATLGFRTRGDDPTALHQFAELLIGGLRQGQRAGLAALDPQAQIAAAMELVRRNPIVALPQDFVLLGRVLTTLGGLIVRYRPSVDLATAILPALTRAMAPQPSASA